ncbi:hypothetical protein M408DRAFT_250060 [Serendipita vermifera MAFF 305830]|uniref:Uncharacterized protein n=1 Tax=Serendipita vermifera MAFF 305830 TaxID=933852 RepID=A0A0C2WBH3_SERVB|nr:hypothetical protein M408DRAFT_250060 [Serendipita vermifera MAFF 305830]
MPNTLLSLPALYTFVGLYRLIQDPKIRNPVWDKCRNGTKRGLLVAAIYGVVMYSPQRWFVSIFLSNSSRLQNLFMIPYVTSYFSLQTWATLIFITNQMSGIIRFFLSKNLRIAKDRAWDLTVISRGKSKDFWGPYAEEWEQPPQIRGEKNGDGGGVGWLERSIGKWWARLLINKFILFPLQLYPVVGIFISAWMRAYGTSRYLHSKYFKSKNMTPHQISIYMEERKWDYRIFGVAAALLESLPIVGILFAISNQIGAAMWAHDLEKRQALFRTGVRKPLPPHQIKMDDGTTITTRPAGTGLFSAISGKGIQSGMNEPEIPGGFTENSTTPLE